MKKYVLCLLLTVALMSTGNAYANLLVNEGFEATTDTTGSWPTDVGYWRGDYSAIVAASDGITPAEGSQMLKLIYTASYDPAEYWGSEVMQLVDVRSFGSEISQGYAYAIGSASFNRVAGDAETDTEFRVWLRAFAGEPTTFLSQYGVSELAIGSATVTTDGTLATWQSAEVELLLPTNTDFLAVCLVGAEDVVNDTVDPEFDGHYADLSSLTIETRAPIPEPAGLGLIGLALLAVRRRRT